MGTQMRRLEWDIKVHAVKARLYTGVRGANQPVEVAQTVNKDRRGLKKWVENRQSRGLSWRHEWPGSSGPSRTACNQGKTI